MTGQTLPDRVSLYWEVRGPARVYGWCTAAARLLHSWCTVAARLLHGWCTAKPWPAALRESLLLLLLLLVGSLLIFLSPVHLNLSASIPVGVYRSVQQPLRRGALVAVCLPPAIAEFGLRRGYVRPGSCASGVQPLVKPIGALAGDRLDIRAARILVNGQPLAHSATRPQDRHGRRLAHVAWGERSVAPGMVWLFATRHPRSWDSRYFGPVAVETILSGVAPVWTWEEAS